MHVPPGAGRSARSVSTTGTPKRNMSHRERIYREIRERIQRGEIGLDDRLVDHDVAKAAGTSRMPAREALLQLRHEGLLRSTARGFMLRRFRRKELHDIFEMRELIEPPAAVMASRNAQPQGLEAMQAALSATEEAWRNHDVAAFVRHNASFRMAWVDMVPNQVLASTIARFIDHVQIIRLATMADPATRTLILNGMTEVNKAFRQRDEAALHACMLRQVRAAAESYDQLYRAGRLPPAALPLPEPGNQDIPSAAADR